MNKWILISLLLFSWIPSRKNDLVQDNAKFADKQMRAMLQQLDGSIDSFPHAIYPDGKLKLVDIYGWTSGFFPGSLWLAYQLNNKDTFLLNHAIEWTNKLEPVKNLTSNHDIGFMMYCSYGNAYRITKKEAYKDILIQSANSLCTRFNPKVGCIKSWDDAYTIGEKVYYQYPVIMDNMMNLELLCFASNVTHNPKYREIAISHADKTLENNIRGDYSSFHVVNYDSITGKPLFKVTHQGYANNSTWARGQAWGIYGFTMMYRETRQERYLNAACKMADYFLDNKNLPTDKIPYWDFNIGQLGYNPPIQYDTLKRSLFQRDVSSAAIVCSALFELYGFTKHQQYYKDAVAILQALSSPAYRNNESKNGFLLKHSVGNFPGGYDIDVPICYADYYFLEALQRYQQYNKKG
ncbi:glycoside hydrolase family 88 protein [Parasediminibacterium sp. JCM 36343]|uniref:glycoside hydrolase family 88 protein n=1 Tax=Parasediminibacterium sp. JCM 36343 TaxID=3374279 RepID=UPI00397D1C47